MKLRLIVLFSVCFIASNLFAAGKYTITAHHGDGSGAEASFDGPVRTHVGAEVAHLTAAHTRLTDCSVRARARLARTAAHLGVSTVPAMVTNLPTSLSPGIDFNVIRADVSAQSVFSLAAHRLLADINTAVIAARLGGSAVLLAHIDAAFATYRRAVTRAAIDNRIGVMRNGFDINAQAIVSSDAAFDDSYEVIAPGAPSRH